jgi:hypothetical protein
VFGNAFAQKRGDIRLRRHFIERWQAGEIELRRCLGFSRRFSGHLGIGNGRFTLGLFGLLLALRPSRQKAFVVTLVRGTHARPVPSSGPRLPWTTRAIATCPIALAFVERPLDMKFVDKGGNPGRDLR